MSPISVRAFAGIIGIIICFVEVGPIGAVDAVFEVAGVSTSGQTATRETNLQVMVIATHRNDLSRHIATTEIGVVAVVVEASG